MFYCGVVISVLVFLDLCFVIVLDCKKGSDVVLSKVSVKLVKGIGIDFEFGDIVLSYFFVVLVVLLIISVLWLVVEKVMGGDGLGIVGLLFVGLVVFGLGGLLGYWWKGDCVMILKVYEVD